MMTVIPPSRRTTGICLIVIFIASLFVLTVSGYDPSPSADSSELRRLAGITEWQVSLYAAIQVLSGLAILASAVILGLLYAGVSVRLALFSSLVLATAAILAVLTSALYVTAATLADEWLRATPEHAGALLTATRAFIMVISALAPVTMLLMALGVAGYGLALVRSMAIPRWLGAPAVMGIVLIATGWVAGVTVQSDSSWALSMGGESLLLLWQLITGIWMIVGGSSRPRGFERTIDPGQAGPVSP